MKDNTTCWKERCLLSVSNFLELILSACLSTCGYKRVVLGEDKFT